MGGVQCRGGLEEKKLPLQGDEEEKGDVLVDQNGGEEEKGDALVDQNGDEEKLADALVDQAGVEEEQADAIVDQQGGRVEVAAVGGVSPVSKKRKALLR